MGTEYVIVDDEGKNALDVFKWYELSHAVAEAATNDFDYTVTPEVIKQAAGSHGRKQWLINIALHWLEHIAKGRTCHLWNDGGSLGDDTPWAELDSDNWYAEPGWTCYETHTPANEHATLYRPFGEIE